MKFKCQKCGAEFEAKTGVKCPQCSEVINVRLLSKYDYKQSVKRRDKG
jgi:DNA-directed RNA polymerase subunit RPC12/RpoP